MKKLGAVLGLCFLLITACIFYLLKHGISVRAAQLIRPSLIHADFGNVANALVLRLSPELISHPYVLWGFLNPKASNDRIDYAEAESSFAKIKAEAERLHKRPVQVIRLSEETTQSQIGACTDPCWILMPADQSNELKLNQFIEEKIRPLAKAYINITYVPFRRIDSVPENCTNEKHLDFDCLKAVSVHESQRKMRSNDRYFFLRKYMDRDYFLFIESQPQAK